MDTAELFLEAYDSAELNESELEALANRPIQIVGNTFSERELMSDS